MNIEIPQDAEAFVKRQAAAAGFETISEYVISLVLQDEKNRSYEDEVAQNPRLEELALQGIESGPATPLDVDSIRRELRKKSSEQQE